MMHQDTRMGQWGRRGFLRAATVATGLLAGAGTGLWRRRRPPPVSPFTIATLSDAQLTADGVNPRFGQALDAAIDAINRLRPAPDFVVYGGNLWRMGDPEGLREGRAKLQRLAMPVHMVVGEHDWYRDLGQQWQRLFGAPTYSFDHKGVHVVVLMNVHTQNFWRGPNLTGAERMHTVAALTSATVGPFQLGPAQLAWLRQDLRHVHPETPVLVISHGPLFDCYAPWHFATADAEAAHQLLAPFAHVALLHGHCQQMVVAQPWGRPSFGMVSTAWSWPPPPRGLNAPTRALHQQGPAEQLGFGELWVQGRRRVQKRYHLVGQRPLSVTRSL
jgi:hypothetical protein